MKRKRKEMAKKILRCNICGEYFQSKKDLKDHKDKNHRITNSKIVGLTRLIVIITITDWLYALNY
jgi:uncharacterized C2H2 Zn-finger protein